jgi:AraC-like DNA-binding protein
VQRVSAAQQCVVLQRAKVIALARSGPSISAAGRRLRGREMAGGRIYRLEQSLRHFPHTQLKLLVLAEDLNMQKNQCCTVFREVQGRSFVKQKRRLLIEIAQNQLRHGGCTITAVSCRIWRRDCVWQGLQGGDWNDCDHVSAPDIIGPRDARRRQYSGLRQDISTLPQCPP